MSRHQNAGQLLRTGSGKLGIWYNRDKPVQCDDGQTRVFVTLVDEQFRPLPDTKPILCNPDNCRLLGFQD